MKMKLLSLQSARFNSNRKGDSGHYRTLSGSLGRAQYGRLHHHSDPRAGQLNYNSGP